MKTLLLTLLSLAVASSLSASTLTQPADKLAFKSIGEPAEQTNWQMKSNGYLGTLIKVARSGKVTVTVKASGNDALMHVHLGNARLAQAVDQSEWKDYSYSVKLAPGTYWVRVELTNTAPNAQRSLRVSSVSVSGAEFRNTADDQTVLDAADTFIENYRKGAAEIILTDSKGKPLAAGTEVHVKLKRHSFNFGTAVYGIDFRSGDWLQKNPAQGSDADKYQQFVNSHFNMIVPENAGKWAFCEGQRDVETMDFIDGILDYAKRNNLRARMHCVAWGESLPKWTKELIEKNEKSELRDEISERIKCLVKDRADNFIEVDGINESAHQDAFLKMYGPKGIGDIYEEIVKASNGRARVYFNEYCLFQWSRQFGYKDDYGNWYKDHIESILNAGIKPEDRNKIGIGMQYYPVIQGTSIKENPHSPVRIAQTLQLLSIFEFPMSLTEFAANDGSQEAASACLSDTMRLVFGSNQTTSFLTWGFHPSHMWLKGSAFVDKDWNLTLCGKTYEQLLGIKDWGIPGIPTWNTDLNLKTDKRGKITFRGFYGDYEISAGEKHYKFSLSKGKSNYRL